MKRCGDGNSQNRLATKVAISMIREPQGAEPPVDPVRMSAEPANSVTIVAAVAAAAKGRPKLCVSATAALKSRSLSRPP